MYIINYKDYCGKIRIKRYKTAGKAITAFFNIYSWYKNGTLTRDGRQIL